FRAEELSSDTGVPAPYECVYYSHFNNMLKSEQEAHYRLRFWAYNKEFFACSAQNAIQIIESLGGTRCFLSIPIDYEYITCPICRKNNRVPKDSKGGLCGVCRSALRPKAKSNANH
ncbi:MAG: GIY-YIG nuclease family protein, partial [Methylobacter sp.]